MREGGQKGRLGAQVDSRAGTILPARATPATRVDSTPAVRATLVRVLIELLDARQFKPPDWLLAFGLARRCRIELPALDAISALEALTAVDELGLPWWRLLGFSSSCDAETRLLDAWERICFLPGTLEETVRHGLAEPALLPRRLSRPHGLACFVAALGRLQERSAPRPVVLSQTAFSQALGVDQATVSRWTAQLRQERVLCLECDYWHPKKPNARLEELPQRRAATYWVDLPRIGALRSEAAAEAAAAEQQAAREDTGSSTGSTSERDGVDLHPQPTHQLPPCSHPDGDRP